MPGQKFQLVRRWVLALVSTGGTRFCQADLTRARFNRAVLAYADFRGTKIQDTRWSQAIQLQRAHFDQVLLPSPSDAP